MQVIKTDSGEVNIIEDHFDVLTVETHAKHKTLGALDIETTLTPDNPWMEDPQLVSVAITFDGYRAFVFGPGTTDALRPVLEHKDWIMHNGLFDRLMMLEFFGYDLPLKHDTMAMQYLLDPDVLKSLEECSMRYLKLPSYKDVDYEHILDEPFEKIAKMNGEDTLRTFNLLRPLGDMLNEDPALSRVYQWILMPAIQELITITQNGIPLDGERLAKVTEATQEEVHDLLQELCEATPLPWESTYPKGWPRPSKWRVNDVIDKETGEVLRYGDGKWDGTMFNPGSSNQVKHILFEQWDLPILKYTKDKETGEDTDNPSADADVLLLLETYHTEGEQQEWLHSLRAYRKATKLLTYFTAWPALQDERGWLHPRYRPLRTVTGRLSSNGPNIQNVPRTNEVRSCFVAPEGYTWMKADYSQMELRLAADAAQEHTMLDAFHNGDDIHELTAKMVLGETSPEARRVGKTLNFGLLFGAGAGTLQRIARADYGMFFSLEEARYYKDQFFQGYHDLQSWHRKCEHEIESTGLSRSPLGRVRYLPKAKIPATVHEMWPQKMAAMREGINHRIQSFASDIILVALAAVVPKVQPYGAYLVAEVHDEIDLLVPNEHVLEVAGIVKATMEDLSWLDKHGIELGVPVLCDVETGPNWGNVQELEMT